MALPHHDTAGELPDRFHSERIRQGAGPTREFPIDSPSADEIHPRIRLTPAVPASSSSARISSWNSLKQNTQCARLLGLHESSVGSFSIRHRLADGEVGRNPATKSRNCAKWGVMMLL